MFTEPPDPSDTVSTILIVALVERLDERGVTISRDDVSDLKSAIEAEVTDDIIGAIAYRTREIRDFLGPRLAVIYLDVTFETLGAIVADRFIASREDLWS